MSKKILRVKVCEARGLPKMDIIGSSDPYVVLSVDGRTRRTEYIKNDLSPTWNTVLEFDFAVKEDIGKHSLLVQCFDHDMIGSDDFIGGHTVPLKDYVDGAVHNQWFTLQDKKHGNRGEVRLEISVVKV